MAEIHNPMKEFEAKQEEQRLGRRAANAEVSADGIRKLHAELNSAKNEIVQLQLRVSNLEQRMIEKIYRKGSPVGTNPSPVNS
jgi:hypothetical protein